ncbi:S9 family peptidase [Psychrosphaera sp. B3R10]|uniref:S9 family peptidase n=1 Tax=unclassified Psychrosphaera TaxID=2641570 RepID=UPI001C0828F2|nr:MULTISPECIES: DPP IV N-terminal domain-containing protein [unclassified Psychrosphaera]MBU2882517.1 S9 family peptidase [Psychrosphaera sp. I2R16]MBU2989465.1 S9 family peptidase [Psychrosphaera sp. B3R10]
MKKLTIILLFILIQTFNIIAQELTLERIYSDPSLAGKTPSKLTVSPDGKRATYIQPRADDYNRYDLWEYNVATGKRSMLVDSESLFSGPESLSDEEKARRERQRIYGKGILEYTWSADGSALLFPLNGDVFYYQLGKAKAEKLTNGDGFVTDVKFSPKGNFVSYVKNQNLYIINLKTKQTKALTTSGKDTIKFAMAEFVAQEEMKRMTGYWWAPDESEIALTKVDTSPVKVATRNEIYADSIKLFDQRYPFAGTPNVKIELGLLKITQSESQIRWIDLGQEQDIYITRGKWLPNSATFSYQWQNRSQHELQLRFVNAKTLSQKTVVTETSDTWINLHESLYYFDDSFVWASERDGFQHLYHIDLKGNVKAQLTKGDWIVDKLVAVDKANGDVYFTGRKDTPIERHLYVVNLNKPQQIKKVSQRSGLHDVTFSEDASVYLDSFSTTTQPPQVSLHQANGKQLTWMEQNKLDASHPLTPYLNDWIKPRFGTITAEDGQTLHYRIFEPKGFTGKRPVINYVYGGPHAQLVTDSWSKRNYILQHLVQKGYVVFQLDNRGSYNRGKKFEDPIYQHLGEVELTDQLTGVEYLKTLDYVDPNRIGVYGHSYGGYMTIMSMFKAGDVFKVGVSGAPVTDWTLYDTHYTERYAGHPGKDGKDYDVSNVFKYAEGLKGDLLIYHGMADDNVLFTHATKLFKHLQDLGKPFDVMTYPGSKHSIRGKKTGLHLAKTIVRYFDKNL